MVEQVIYPAEVIRDLREIVAEFGPDTTRVCSYTDLQYDGTRVPNCIVGVFLNRHGISPDDLMEIEGYSIDTVDSSYFEDHGFVIDNRAMRALTVAQRTQDDGGYWEEALDRAGESIGIDPRYSHTGEWDEAH